MKKLLLALPVLLLVWGTTLGSAATLPPQCNQTYTSTFTVSTNGTDFVGTEGNDLIYVNANNTRIAALGGNDCVVVSGTGNQIAAGNGDDVVQGTSQANFIAGGAGNDYLQGGSATRISGGEGVDTCVVGPSSLTASCEL
jgi:Ca2+-binding RTX toxin-like protein